MSDLPLVCLLEYGTLLCRRVHLCPAHVWRGCTLLECTYNDQHSTRNQHCLDHLTIINKGKGMVLYSAVSSPLDRSKRFTLSSPGRPVHSNTNSASLGSILAMQQLRNDYSITCPPLSLARYSFIQLSRLRHREANENAQTSKR